MTVEAKTSEFVETPDVSWTDVVRFVRQVSHDLRNHLNVVELQIAYVLELQHDPEVRIEITRLREMTFEISAELQKLMASLGQVELQTMPYKASEFLEDLKKKVEAEFPKERASVEWKSDLGDEMLQIDPHQMLQAMLEIFANAFQHGRSEGPISVAADAEAGRFTFTLREPKASFQMSTEKWAREPLRYGARAHYGLGLHHARVILETHRGNLKARHEGSSLITTIALPLLTSGA